MLSRCVGQRRGVLLVESIWLTNVCPGIDRGGSGLWPGLEFNLTCDWHSSRVDSSPLGNIFCPLVPPDLLFSSLHERLQHKNSWRQHPWCLFMSLRQPKSWALTLCHKEPPFRGVCPLLAYSQPSHPTFPLLFPFLFTCFHVRSPDALELSLRTQSNHVYRS